MLHKNIIFIFLIFILYFINIEAQACSTNMECKETGCCHDNACESKSKCKKRNKLCYAFVGIGAFVVNVLIAIYFIRKIRETKRHLEYLRKTELGSLSRERQYRESQFPKNTIPTTQNL